MGLHVGQDAAKAFSEQAKAMGWEEDDMADDEGIVCIICREGYKYKPEEVVQKYLLYWYKSTCFAGTTVQILTRKALLGAGRLCVEPPLLHLAVDRARRGRRRYSFLLALLVPNYKS